MESNKDNSIRTLKSKKVKKGNDNKNEEQIKREPNLDVINEEIVLAKDEPKIEDKKKVVAKKIYKCDECNFTAVTPSNFLKHLTSDKHKRHGEKKINKCDKCEYVSNSIYNYNVHNITQHGTTEEKKEKCPFYCNICDVGFFSKIFHDKHINSKNHSNLKLIKEIQDKEKENK